jgi:hypothetical protein
MAKKQDTAPVIEPQTATDAIEVTHLRVRAITGRGFQRAGRHWTNEWTTVSIDEFTDAQVQSLIDEHYLQVEMIAG